jgi:predicted metal-dependent phosphoesterase TrpH
MRCDLHVHTLHSGMCTLPLLKHFCRECYSEPQAVYETLKGLGMDLVTVTDHDSIDAGTVLARHPDFFLSEEVTCTMPSGTEIHIGAYDITEQQHLAIQCRRDDVPRLLAYFREQDILFSLNHVFSSLTGRRERSDWTWFESMFPILEVRNGHMLPCVNSPAVEFARTSRKSGFAGSDAHTLLSLGTAFTEVRGARNRVEFIEGLKMRQARVHGRHGSYYRLTRDLLWLALRMIREQPSAAILLPLVSLIPLVTLGNYVNELAFSRRWRQNVGQDPDRSASPKPIGSERFAV